MKKCVALVSGGLDSMCYLAQQIGQYEILPLVFNYGQVCHKEIDAACHILEELEKDMESIAHRRILHMEFLAALCPGTQLTGDVPASRSYEPSVVVPLRNFIFLLIAAAHAKSLGATRIIAGIHTDDGDNWLGSPYPMYPDRTREALAGMEEDIHKGYFWWEGDRLEIWTPTRGGLSKAANLKKGFEVIGERVYDTWSCHRDQHKEIMEKHCGVCLSCRERREAFRKAGIEDKTKYVV